MVDIPGLNMPSPPSSQPMISIIFFSTTFSVRTNTGATSYVYLKTNIATIWHSILYRLIKPDRYLSFHFIHISVIEQTLLSRATLQRHRKQDFQIDLQAYETTSKTEDSSAVHNSRNTMWELLNVRCWNKHTNQMIWQSLLLTHWGWWPLWWNGPPVSRGPNQHRAGWRNEGDLQIQNHG